LQSASLLIQTARKQQKLKSEDRMIKSISLSILLLAASGVVAQDLKTLPTNSLIDNPTAGILDRGHFSFDMTLYTDGGLLFGFTVGLMDRLNMGASFGGTNIISDLEPDWNQRPELTLKYRIFDESVTFPALSIGYSGQGHGRWLNDDFGGDAKDANRYEIKAKGFYAAAGKNYIIGNMGMLGLHLGANINPVENDDDQGLNMWFGIDKEINDELTVVSEYDFAFNDVKTQLSGSKGFLNLGIRWTFAERLSIEVDFKDLLKNREDLTGRPVNSVYREIKITYIEVL
jgi:hypothetical protein